MTAKKTLFLSRAVHWSALFIGIGVLLGSLRFPGGDIGHDYKHAFTRFLIGAGHFWTNGLQLPHYTAALCGGVPFLADPQSTYFSLTQWLVFAFDPWIATLVTVAAFAALGYLGFLALVREVLKATGPVAHLVSLAFVLNGFSYAHLLVGHLTHHSYFLAPWLLYFAFRRREFLHHRWWRDLGIASLLCAYVLYSGGLHTAVVLGVMLVLALPALLLRHQGCALKPFLLFALGVAVLSVVAGAGKIYSGWSYARVFWPREIDIHPLSLWSAVQTYLWVTPEITPGILSFGKWDFGAWEYVGFVTKLTIPALLYFVIFAVGQRSQKPIVAAIATASLAFIIVLIATGRFGNASILLLRSYHNPSKILGAFLPLLLLLLAWALSTVKQFLGSPWLFLAAMALILGEFQQNASFLRRIPEGGGFRWRPQIYADLRAKHALPTVEKVSTRVGDIESIALGETSLACFEPLFGYRLEGYKAELEPGSTRDAVGGYFNLTHPGCLVYPEHFSCRPWERVPVAENEAFEDLIHGRQPPWTLPPWQNFCNLLSALALGLILIFFLKGLSRSRTPV